MKESLAWSCYVGQIVWAQVQEMTVTFSVKRGRQFERLLNKLLSLPVRRQPPMATYLSSILVNASKDNRITDRYFLSIAPSPLLRVSINNPR